MVLNFLRRLELHDTVGKMAVEELAQRLEHGDEVSQVNVVIKNYSEKLDGQVLQSSSFSKSEEQNETPAGGREVEKSDADMGGHLGEPVLDETALESWVKTLMARAVVFSKMAGISDPLTERLLEEILTTRVPWATLLKRALEEGVGSRILQTYQKPHRRLSDLPGVKRHTKRVVVCVDVSGSISDEEYARFVSIIQSLSHSCEIIFIAWDTVATNLGKVKTRSELEKVARRAKGYGGTQPNCLVPLLKKLRPHLTVILTDGRWGAWSDLAHWSRGRRVIVATTYYVDPAWRFWRIIRVGKE